RVGHLHGPARDLVLGQHDHRQPARLRPPQGRAADRVVGPAGRRRLDAVLRGDADLDPPRAASPVHRRGRGPAVRGHDRPDRRRVPAVRRPAGGRWRDLAGHGQHGLGCRAQCDRLLRGRAAAGRLSGAGPGPRAHGDLVVDGAGTRAGGREPGVPDLAPRSGQARPATVSFSAKSARRPATRDGPPAGHRPGCWPVFFVPISASLRDHDAGSLERPEHFVPTMNAPKQVGDTHENLSELLHAIDPATLLGIVAAAAGLEGLERVEIRYRNPRVQAVALARSGGSKIVDCIYTVYDARGRAVEIWLLECELSWDGSKRRRWSLYVVAFEYELDADGHLVVFSPEPRLRERI